MMEASKSKSARSPRAKKGDEPNYIVLRKLEGGETWAEAAQVHAPSQRDAKRVALKTKQRLRDQALKPEGITLVALPLASWNPTNAKYEQREPVLRLG
jgi:hypothetical protein